MASGSKQLLDLPGDVQVQVLGNLGVRDVARTLRSCHALAQLAQGQSPLWREVLVRECGLDLADGARARGVLRQLRETRTARIHFVGVLTDGGIDSPYTPGAEDDEPSLPSGNPASLGERDLQYWVTSMFLPVPWLIYCSASGRTDILCAATLVGYYDEYGEAQEQSRRDYMLERLALIAGEQWNMTIDGFGGLSSASPEVLDEAFFAASEMDIQLLLHGPHLEKGAHLLKIRRLRAQIQQKWSLRRARGASLLCTLRAENGRTAVFAPQEEEASPSSPCAVLSRLTVRRPVSCSCPASHGVIFASRERIDGVALLDCPTLDAACAQLLILPGGWAGSAGSGSVEHIEGVGHVVRRTALAEGEILEVEAPPSGPHGLYPIALFSFRPLAEMAVQGLPFSETGLLAAQLFRPRTARFIAVKLLRAEDRMELCKDDHQDMNIDMDFVGFEGHIVSMDGEVRSPDECTGDGSD